MIKVMLESILPSPSRKVISEWEDEYEIQFPADYLDFIAENNGAIPIDRLFMHNQHEYVVERFLCILDEEVFDDLDESCYDIGVVTEELEERLGDDGDATGVSIVPIAALFAGDFICLDFRNDEQAPSVCIWYHEESSYLSPVVSKVADNFNSFLEMLYE